MYTLRVVAKLPFCNTINGNSLIKIHGGEMDNSDNEPVRSKDVTFVDYKFVLKEDNTIIFDEELTLDHLRIENGDYLMAVQCPETGNVMLKRIKQNGTFQVQQKA